MLNPATIVTLLRLMAIPLLVIAFYLPVDWNHIAATSIFVLAAVTDWLDGYLARQLNVVTQFGAFLDPVVDKLIVSIALILVVSVLPAIYLTVPAAIIIGREITISALREWMAELGKRTQVSVSRLGKYKTAMQLTALTVLLLYKPSSPEIMLLLGTILLIVSAFLTLLSMLIYLRAAWTDLTLSANK